MNRTVLLGRTTKDIDLRYAQSGTAVANFTLAVNRNFKDKQTGQYEADFIRCIAFGKTAETMAQYVKKGHQLGIEGRIQTGSYEKDGQRVYTTDVVVDQFYFLEPKKDRSKPSVNEQAKDLYKSAGEPTDPTDDDLPF